jgi:dTDP-glucose pyrophosphorylase
LHTAYVLTQIKADINTVAAGILHDVPEDTKHTLKEIKQKFGEDIYNLVNGVTKLGTIKYKDEKKYRENLRKMFVAMAKDVRVIFIKFCDRLHNLRTLEALPPNKQNRIAKETLDIYVPVADLLGMWRLKWQMEDICFKILQNKEYRKLEHKYEIEKIYNLCEIKSILPLEAVIMAGGEGTRLRPLTDNTPKPLLKIGDKPIIEHNIDRLIAFGIENITISVRYLGDQIIDYFGNGAAKKNIDIRYIKEKDPLGTAGSLGLIDSFKSETILLTNSDVLTTLDYEEFYLDFVERDADISIVSIPYKVKVPYGIFEYTQQKISALKEKPEYTYYSNAGIYLIKKNLIVQIPKGKHLDITDFIEKQIENGKNVVSFPFWGYWLDIGNPEDFENAQKAIQILDSY